MCGARTRADGVLPRQPRAEAVHATNRDERVADEDCDCARKRGAVQHLRGKGGVRRRLVHCEVDAVEAERPVPARDSMQKEAIRTVNRQQSAFCRVRWTRSTLARPIWSRAPGRVGRHSRQVHEVARAAQRRVHDEGQVGEQAEALEQVRRVRHGVGRRSLSRCRVVDVGPPAP